MKILYVCEYPYVLYKVLIKAALNKEDIMDIIITNRIEEMLNIVENIKKSRLFRNVYIFDLKSLKLKYDMQLYKRQKNVIKQRIYELKICKYFYHISNKKKLNNFQ